MSLGRVLVTRRIPGDSLPKLLRTSGIDAEVCMQDRPLTHDELISKLSKGKYHAVLSQLSDSFDRSCFEAAGKQLKIVANYAVGYNNVDVKAAKEHKVTVTNTPGVLTDATADIAWTLLLGIARRAGEGERLLRAGKFTGMGPEFLLGTALEGKTLSIIGAGRIGKAVAKRAKGWDMNVLFFSRSKGVDGEYGKYVNSLDEALKNADFVSVHVPLMTATHHLITKEKMLLMKPTAYLINTSRGPVIDEKALVEVLKEKIIAGAGLDVYEKEPKLSPGLQELENVMLLPHLGSATIEARSKMAEICVDSILDVFGGRRAEHTVV